MRVISDAGPPPGPDLDERADDVPHHVAQEPVPFDANDERPCRVRDPSSHSDRADRPHGRCDDRAGALEGGEIVRADDERGGLAHRVEIERLRHVPGVPVKERRDERGVHDAVS